MDEAFLLLFPAVLKEKLKMGEISFPNGTEYRYHDIEAYRCYFRKENEKNEINREDFRSHAELKIQLRGKNVYKRPEYYGTSLFTSLEELQNIESLNRPQKHIAKGYIQDKGGPVYRNIKNSHICWWLYEKADVSSFRDIEEEQENG